MGPFPPTKCRLQIFLERVISSGVVRFSVLHALIHFSTLSLFFGQGIHFVPMNSCLGRLLLSLLYLSSLAHWPQQQCTIFLQLKSTEYLKPHKLSKTVNNSCNMLDHGEDTDPEALALSFHHQGPTFIVSINQVCSRLTIYALMNEVPRW